MYINEVWPPLVNSGRDCFRLAHSTHPHLRCIDDDLNSQASHGLSYTYILDDRKFLSVPQSVFVGPSRVLMKFRPAGFQTDRTPSMQRAPEGFLVPRPVELSSRQGWTEVVDCDVHENRRLRCTSTTWKSSFSARNGANMSLHGSQSAVPLTTGGGVPGSRGFFLQGGGHRRRVKGPLRDSSNLQSAGSVIDDELHFLVLCSCNISELPAEQELKNIHIYPVLTLINTAPAVMDVSLLTKPSNTYASRRCVLQPHSTRQVYDVPSPDNTLSLSMKLRFHGLEGAGWSEGVDILSPCPQDDIVVRVQLPNETYSSVEIEVHRSAEVIATGASMLDTQQLACLISAPRWLVDRTGTGIRALRDGKVYPQFNRVTLLGDSQHVNIDLFAAEHDEGRRRWSTTIPHLGHNMDSSTVMADGSGRTFTIRTDKISAQDTLTAVARLVSVLPRILILNRLPRENIRVRQSGVERNYMTVRSGELSIMTWPAASWPMMIEFKPATPGHATAAGDDYAWSSKITPTEENAGQMSIALANTALNTSKAFLVSVIPDHGVVTVAIAEVNEYNTECPGYFLVNRCPYVAWASLSVLDKKSIPISTKRQKSTNTRIGRTRSLAVVESGGALTTQQRNQDRRSFQYCFYAVPGQVSAFGWPYPWSSQPRECRLALWLDRETVAPRESLQIDFSGPTNKQFVLDELPIPTLISVSTKGDRVVILVRPKHRRITPLAPLLSKQLSTTGMHHNRTGTLTGLPAEDNWSPQLAVVPTHNEEGVVHEGELRQQQKKPVDEGFHFWSVILAQVGISLVSAHQAEELIFAELSQCMFAFLHHPDEQKLEFRLTDLQIDTQIPVERPVLLANRGGVSQVLWERNHAKEQSSRGAAKSSTGTRTGVRSNGDDTGSSFSGSMVESRGTQRAPQSSSSAVQRRDVNFLHLFVQRSECCKNDFNLDKVVVQIDDLELEVNDEVLDGLSDFFQDCLRFVGSSASGHSINEILAMTKLPFHKSYNCPQLPQVIVLRRLSVCSFTITLWCSFVLDRFTMLNDFLRLGLRVLMISGKIELCGAPCHLQNERIETVRGSTSTMYRMLQDKYINQVLNNMLTLAGSSLASTLRVPLELGRTVGGGTLHAVDSVSTGVGAFLSNLTFDPDYINRRQKERVESRMSSGIKEGLASASRNFTEGMLSVTNIVTKPIEGMQREGVAGLVKGIGKGVAGTLVKPVDKMGQAISNLAVGLRAEYIAPPLGGYKLRQSRRRKPRMLWGEHNIITDYSAEDAELREALPAAQSKNVTKCITVAKRDSRPAYHFVVIFHPKRVFFMNLQGGEKSLSSPSTQQDVNRRDTKGKRGAATACQLWSVQIAEMSDVRASSNGVVIMLSERDECRQIPCDSASLIYQLREELLAAKTAVTSHLTLTRDTLAALNVNQIAKQGG
eukprot:Lankesteria_metandrocarpae@DN3847_c0_g1_i1.p1